MAYASLRFADVQKLQSAETNDDSIYGALTASEAKKQHGHRRPRACREIGIASSTNLGRPLLGMRHAYAEANGRETQYISPRREHPWGVVAEGRTPYSTKTRKLSIAVVWKGGDRGESHT